MRSGNPSEYEMSPILMIALMIAVLAIIIGPLYYLDHAFFEEKGKACKELGYLEYDGGDLRSKIEYCIDDKGDYHTVRMECTGFFSQDCTAKNIKVQSYNP